MLPKVLLFCVTILLLSSVMEASASDKRKSVNVRSKQIRNQHHAHSGYQAFKESWEKRKRANAAKIPFLKPRPNLPLNLVDGDIVTLRAVSRRVSATVGQPVTLITFGTLPTCGSVSWKHNGEKIREETGRKSTDTEYTPIYRSREAFLGDYESHMRIESVQPSDFGDYECEAEYINRLREKITITLEPDNAASAPPASAQPPNKGMQSLKIK